MLADSSEQAHTAGRCQEKGLPQATQAIRPNYILGGAYQLCRYLCRGFLAQFLPPVYQWLNLCGSGNSFSSDWSTFRQDRAKDTRIGRYGYDISGFSGQTKVILAALKKYGMILADNGSLWYISGRRTPDGTTMYFMNSGVLQALSSKSLTSRRS